VNGLAARRVPGVDGKTVAGELDGRDEAGADPRSRTLLVIARVRTIASTAAVTVTAMALDT
jgi:hypothetical protein